MDTDSTVAVMLCATHFGSRVRFPDLTLRSSLHFHFGSQSRLVEIANSAGVRSHKHTSIRLWFLREDQFREVRKIERDVRHSAGARQEPTRRGKLGGATRWYELGTALTACMLYFAHMWEVAPFTMFVTSRSSRHSLSLRGPSFVSLFESFLDQS